MLCENKVALVTGAAGNGMGRSIALTLAREGASVVVNYLTSAESAKAIIGHIESQKGSATAFRADITKQDECKALVDTAVGPMGSHQANPLKRNDIAFQVRRFSGPYRPFRYGKRIYGGVLARAHRHHIAAHVRHPTHRCQKREFLLEFGRDRQWTVGQAALDEGNPEQWHPCGKRARNEYFSYGSSPGL